MQLTYLWQPSGLNPHWEKSIFAELGVIPSNYKHPLAVELSLCIKLLQIFVYC